MKVSVLIAAYKAGSTIAAALASVRAQTHRDWELIVVEDGSHDATEAIVRRFSRGSGQAVLYSNAGSNQGVAAARTRLLALATGGAVAFLDADDFWSPEHLEAGLGLLASGAGLVATGIRIFELSTGRTLKESRPPPCLATDPLRTLFAESAIVTSSSVLLSRDVVLRTGAFDPDFRVGEDRDYWLRAALAGGRFAIAPAPTCHYAKHAGNTMSRTLLVAAQTVRFYEKYFNLAEIPRTLRRQSLAHSLLNEGRLLRRSDARASTRQLWRGWRLQPCDVDLAAHLALSGGRALFHSQVESS